ncbi:hypothetical protein [Streptomyces sp. FIT100]|uniref:hypothetical protein n=1 Tax=Streptomyces sp. FIT100 TaxID=2837956 RepID=UPI0021C85530|nr:hypothetical protein [Streptomyces sp. FIT100]UUN26202.1 hypothetical protein KK483_07040 [Streptomyces sp. FIT100]
MNSRLAALGTLTLMALAQPTGVRAALADGTGTHSPHTQTHSRSHNASTVSLISTGEVDDPLEDVLEHATILGEATSPSDPPE